MQIYANPWPKTKQHPVAKQLQAPSCDQRLQGLTQTTGQLSGQSEYRVQLPTAMPFCDIVLHNLHLELQIELPNYR